MGATMVTGLRLSAATLVLAAGMAVLTPGASANANPPPTTSSKPVCPTGGRGTVMIDGGSVTNTTDLNLSANGGDATGDASGGDRNLAAVGNGRDDNGRGNNGRTSNDVAAAGNGGTAGASANGGAIDVGNVNSGGNTGNAISVGNTSGSGNGCAPAVSITGGTVTNRTTIDVSADGGTAIADASGGDDNVAIAGRAGNGNASAGNGGVASAGNGGTANASANGGAISIGDINSGGNSGNTISVGNTVQTPSGPKPVCCAPPAKPVPGKPVTPAKPGAIKTVEVRPNAGGKAREVASLPSTGAGLVAGAAGVEAALLALGSLFSVGAAGTVLRRRER